MDRTRMPIARTVAALIIPFLITTGLLAQGLPFFLEQTRNGSPEERAAAYEELATLMGPEVEAALAAGIADSSPLVRRAAATAAIGHTSEAVTTALIKAFHDNSVDVQHTVISVFIMNNRPLQEGYRPLLSLLEAPDQDTRAFAAWAVGLYHNPGSISRLKKLFDNGNDLQRANACWAVGEIGSPEGLEMVHQGLADKTASVREKAVAAAGRIGNQSSVSRLEALLKNETDDAVKRAAEQALATLREPPSGE